MDYSQDWVEKSGPSTSEAADGRLQRLLDDLNTLLQQIQCRHISDLFSVLVYTAILDNKFIPLVPEESIDYSLPVNRLTLPKCWIKNRPESYQCLFYPEGYEDFVCKLVIVDVSRVALINLLVVETNTIFSLTLEVEKYVKDDKLLNVKEVMEKIKNRLITPVWLSLENYEVNDDLRKIFRYLNHLYPQLIDKNCTSELIAVFIFAIMLHSDLIPHKSDKYNIETVQLPKSWTKDLFQCTFYSVGFEENLCELTIITNTPCVIVNLRSIDTNTTFGTTLDINHFVPYPKATSIKNKFANLQEIIFKIRNNIITPGRSEMLNNYGKVSASLIGLPAYLQRRIFLYVGALTAYSLANTCKHMRNVALDNSLWKIFFSHDFKEEFEELVFRVDANWLEEYKIHFRRNIDLTKNRGLIRPRRRVEYVYHDLFPFPNIYRFRPSQSLIQDSQIFPYRRKQ